ncbi:MAG: peptidoglycan-binding protein [Deltaproteobacteria bacterium]|nr:peptidoglycan-binding protein [Deltaproteobacteria bacterium]
MKPGTYHVVEQGQSVESIAALARRLPKVVWDAPENKELRDKRKEPHVLMPGDRLFLPAIEAETFDVPTGEAKAFVLDQPDSRLQVRIVEGTEPRAGKPWVLRVDGKELRGTTDGDGKVDCPVPVLARVAELTVGEGAEAVTYELELRGLDPITEPTGLQARLANLGYDSGPVDGDAGPRTRAALAAFQKDNGLEPTGELDASTRSKLEEKHGC